MRAAGQNRWIVTFNAELAHYRTIGIAGTDTAGNATVCVFEPVPVAVTETKNWPEMYRLDQNYPNPFNPTTTINFQIPHSSFVTLKILNLLGQEVATLVSEARVAGGYQADWHAEGVASGVYFYRLAAGEFVETKKMLLLR